MYAKLMQHIHRKTQEQCNEKGMAIADGAKFIKVADLEAVFADIFARSSAKSAHDRSLMCLQYQLIGRISEASSIHVKQLQLMDDLSYGEESGASVIHVPIKRTKTGVNQTVGVYHHRTSWLRCCWHALATQMVVGDVLEDKLFPNVGKTCPATYVSQVTDQCQNEELRKIVSHDLRKTAATQAMHHPQINAAWVVMRGGWKADSIHVFFQYLEETPETDAANTFS